MASRAECAKGLVLYHFGSKRALEEAIATDVRSSRLQGRIEALRIGGASALDRLWRVLQDEVRTGRSALWLQLISHPATRGHAAIGPAERRDLATAAGRALALPTDLLASVGLSDRLDGFELALLQGVPPAEERDRFDQFWLSVLSTDNMGTS